MSVTSYNAQFGSKQEQLARNGYVHQSKKMSKDQYEKFLNSPAMQTQMQFDDACAAKTSSRDKIRMKTDKTFKPSDSDWAATKTHNFNVRIDYYRVLGVDEYETRDNIKKAYRRLSLVYHPDKTAGMDEKTAAEHQSIFIEINNAYLVLGDHPTRRQYDKARDDAAVAEELFGQVSKKKLEAQFDAFKVLEELAAKKPKPSATVPVPTTVKLEKMFYGGIKKIKRKRDRETIDGFVTEDVVYEVVVPSRCNENHGILKKAVGNHHKNQKPDNLSFKFKSKRHPRVSREEDDLRLKAPIKLSSGALADPYTSTEVVGLGGRLLLLFGRNPFYGIGDGRNCSMQVAVMGEGFGKEGNLKFSLDYPRATTKQPLLRETQSQEDELHRTLQRRKIRANAQMLECSVELYPLRAPLRLGTKPTSCLQFYGNLKQPTKIYHGKAGKIAIKPRPMFALVMSCPLGAKKNWSRVWDQLRQQMVPLLWLSFWILVPPMRRLQPKSLDNCAAWCETEDEDVQDEKTTTDLQDFFGDADGISVPECEQEVMKEFLVRFKLGPPEGFHDQEMRQQESQSKNITDNDPRSACSLKPENGFRPETESSRPAWANPEPTGPPVAISPSSGKVQPSEQIGSHYRKWTLYPYLVTHQTVKLTDLRDSTDKISRLLGMADAALACGDVWQAHSLFTKAAHMGGHMDRIKSLNEHSNGDEISDTSNMSSSSLNKNSVARALDGRADCLQRLQYFDDAIVDARSAAQLMPTFGQAWRRVGVLAARTGQVAEAWESLFKAVEVDPTDLTSIKMLQKLKWQSKGDAAMQARSEKIVGNGVFAANPSKAIAHYTAALAAMQVPFQQIPEKCEEEDARLLAEILSNRSAAFSRLAIWAAAVADAENALQLPGRQDWMKGNVRLGTALLGLGRYEDAYPHFAKAVAVLPTEAPEKSPALVGRETCLMMAGCWKSRIAQARRARFWMDSGRPQKLTRVYAISDIHFDHPLAEDWVTLISPVKFQEDVLIVAGDVAENLNKLSICLRHLRAKFHRVFFTPGNHDLWIHKIEEGSIYDSIEKLFRVLQLCDELDIDVFPAAVCEGIFVAPLFSWYNAEYDEEDPFPSEAFFFDKYARWPFDRHNKLWRYMLYLNHQFLEMPCHGTVITFSHFLPRRGLPFWSHIAGLVKAVGCTELDEQVRKIKSECHIFGHTHLRCNEVQEGIRYIQNPLGYKNEHNPDEPLCCVFNGRNGSGLTAHRDSIDE